MPLLEFILDTLHAALLYPSGFTRPHVAAGYFSQNQEGQDQEQFFNALVSQGFRTTYFQLIFPGQTAGLIRKIEPPQEGMDEIHIRFYEDGVIAAELEYGRFSLGHWREKRVPSVDILEKLLDKEITNIDTSTRQRMRKQFQERDYGRELYLSHSVMKHPLTTYFGFLGIFAFFAVQVTISTLGSLYYFSEGKVQYGVEPAVGALLGTLLLSTMVPFLRYPNYCSTIQER